MLLRVYAKCIAGRDEINRCRVEDALRDSELDDHDVGNDNKEDGSR